MTINLLTLIISAALFNPLLETRFPLVCQPGQDCWIICSEREGTDIAVKSIKNDIPVLSVQDGTVLLIQEDPENTTVYGNSVIIEHTSGWKTLYTHLKNGSISVKQGDFAGRGTQIGLLGMSGDAQFPRLHFAIFKDGEFHAPFWDLTLSRAVIANTGIAAEDPNLEDIREEKFNRTELLNNTDAIFLWVYGFNFKKGDFIKISLNNPDGNRILDKVITVEQDFDEGLFAVKAEKDAEIWPSGSYMVKTEFIRTDSDIAREDFFSFNIKEPAPPVDEEQLKQQKRLEKIRMLNRRKKYIYKKLMDEGKLPE